MAAILLIGGLAALAVIVIAAALWIWLNVRASGPGDNA